MIGEGSSRTAQGSPARQGRRARGWGDQACPQSAASQGQKRPEDPGQGTSHQAGSPNSSVLHVLGNKDGPGGRRTREKTCGMPGQEGRAALTGSDRRQVPQGKGRWQGAWPLRVLTSPCSQLYARRQSTRGPVLAVGDSGWT